MKKKILTSAILLGLLIGETSCFTPVCFAKISLFSRREKKEAYYFDVATSSFDMKQYELAIEYYTKVIALNPQNSEAYTKRGNAKYMLGQYKDAVKDYTKALEIDPNRENIYYNRGIANQI